MRIRTVKPEFFIHADLADLEAECRLPIRLAYIGLWCAADRDGRFGWNPRRLGVQILPYDSVDFEAILDTLDANGYIQKYEVDGKAYGWIPSFSRHQVINNREADSTIPSLDGMPTNELILETQSTQRTTKQEVLPFGSEDFSEAWERWKAHRAEKKKKITPTTAVMQLKKLEGVGEIRAIKMIDYSIENGWMGLFEDATAVPIPLQRKPQTSDQFSI
jgi:hypothetical protein